MRDVTVTSSSAAIISLRVWWFPVYKGLSLNVHIHVPVSIFTSLHITTRRSGKNSTSPIGIMSVAGLKKQFHKATQVRSNGNEIHHSLDHYMRGNGFAAVLQQTEQLVSWIVMRIFTLNSVCFSERTAIWGINN